jgi:hypothetical protein
VTETDGLMVRYRDRRWTALSSTATGTRSKLVWLAVRASTDAQLRCGLRASAGLRTPPGDGGGTTWSAGRGEVAPVGWHANRTAVSDRAGRWSQVDLGARGHAVGDECAEIVDWYHASERIWTVAKAVHGDDTPRRKRWLRPSSSTSGRPGRNPWSNGSRQLSPEQPAAGAGLQRGCFSTNAPGCTIVFPRAAATTWIRCGRLAGVPRRVRTAGMGV